MRTLFVFLLTIGIAAGAPPGLVVTPPNPQPGDVVTVAGKSALTFEVRGASETLLHPKKTSVTFVMPDSGAVVVMAAGTMPASSLNNVAVVVVGGGGVNPGPGPPPGPVDPVTPSKLFLVVVEETAEAAATRGALFADPTLAQRVKDKGHRWRIVDKDVTGADGQPPADIKKYLDAAKGKAMPQLFLVDEKGKARYAGDLPTKAGELLKLLDAWGG